METVATGRMATIEEARYLLRLSRSQAYVLAKSEWEKAGVAVKIGWNWRIHWTRFLTYYNLDPNTQIPDC